MNRFTYYPVKHDFDVCRSKGQARCLPCLGEPAKQGSVYRTRDGHRFRVERVEACRWNPPVMATMLAANGFPIHDKTHYFGPCGEFHWPYHASSPTDLVDEVQP